MGTYHHECDLQLYLIHLRIRTYLHYADGGRLLIVTVDAPIHLTHGPTTELLREFVLQTGVSLRELDSLYELQELIIGRQCKLSTPRHIRSLLVIGYNLNEIGGIL